MKQEKIPLLAIVGPTACGKTLLSVRLAKKLKGEIICADSMQVYDVLKIGTARPTDEEQQGVRHHLFGVISPFVNFDVSTYIEMAGKCISDIVNRGKLPILVGGTGLYIDLLTSCKKLPDVKTDFKYREKLYEDFSAKGSEYLYNKLCKVDEAYSKKIASTDIRRIIRALELYHSTGVNMTEHNINSNCVDKIYKTCFLGINPEKNLLCSRIYKRVDDMFESGLVEETENILKSGVSEKSNAMQAIGYKQVIAYLSGKMDLAATVDKVKIATRQYAKRQRCWFKRNKEIYWLESPNLSSSDIDKIVLYITGKLDLDETSLKAD